MTPELVHDDDCLFFAMFTVSRLSTVSNVWDDSRILLYAASVSWIVLSYSFLEAICLDSFSLR